jgi:hypothetical protein
VITVNQEDWMKVSVAALMMGDSLAEETKVKAEALLVNSG